MPASPGPFSAAPLIRTKLHPPVARRLVPRRALVELLDSATRKLTLVRAPAGWGKTTLLAEWHAASRADREFAWLALDPADDDPTRFWTYVIAALRTLAPGVGSASLPVLRAPGTSVAEDVIPILLQELEVLQSPATLVIDDYHQIRAEGIHEALARLLEHLAPPLGLVVATRTEPPLPLARLRARGELAEVDADALRFSDDEAGQLLNELHGLRLEPGEVSQLTARTEGWAAGLYLATLSLHGRDDARAFIAEFAGDDRHVVDYLSAEVLAGQTDDVRAFLLRTSILDRLCAPLCDAVTGTSGSAALLRDLERSNLFLVPLDRRREWYRYHHLFAELLRRELEVSEPRAVADLHRRAADWLLESGEISEAIRHRAAAGDDREAAELTALQWNRFLNEGHVSLVAGWLDRLPEATVRADARLCLARAATLLTLGRNAQVEGWLDAAEAAPEPPHEPRTPPVAAEAATYRAVARYRAGDSARALEAARRAIELEEGDSSPWRAMAYAALGRSLFWRAEPDAAEEALRTAVGLFAPPDNVLSTIGALGYLATLCADRDELGSALELTSQAAELAEEHGFSEHWVTAMALAERGRVLRRRGELGEAELVLARAHELADRGAGPVERAYCLLALAAALTTPRDLARARKLIGRARLAVEECADPGLLADLLARAERSVLGRGAGGVPPGDELSLREVEVLRLFASGRSSREIGAELFVSLNTIKSHSKAIFRKLGVASRPEAVARGREQGLL